MSPQQQDVRESVPPLGEPDAAEREQDQQRNQHAENHGDGQNAAHQQ